MRFLSIFDLHGEVATGLATLALAVTLGLILGAVRFRGMRLGVSGVLFSAVAFGQAKLTVDARVLEFLRDFALIVFIYALGLQVGPGFVSSLRAEGLRLNVLSVLVLGLGALMTAGVVKLARLDASASPGIYAGAFTTTPGLAAGQEALRQHFNKGSNVPRSAAGSNDPATRAMARAALSYSVTYPFGVVGPILVIVFLRKIFRVRLATERTELAAAEQERRPPIETVDFKVTTDTYVGRRLKDHPLIRQHGVVFSRLLRDQTLHVPTGETEVKLGDVFRAVGTKHNLAEVVAAHGEPTEIDFGRAAGDVKRMELVVTRTQVLRRSLAELNLIRRHGVTVARVTRAGVDLVPKATLRLMFADNLIVVGPEAGIKAVEKELGNCPDTLNRPQLIPIFLGIVAGVIVGSIPLVIPGLHTTLRIGLAGGPLLAAIVLSQLGNLGSVVWYMPPAANTLFRDFGLAVFLACVGLQAGDNLWHRIIHEGGLTFVIWGIAITILPVFIVACLARVIYKMNFFTLSGWVSGAMTSTTALAFSNDLAGNDVPSLSYAAVAPLATLVPIICAQLLALA